jgi:type I restriction enzyme S subunit
LLVPNPSHEEQNQIVDFLDRKTNQVDELIKKIEQKIELLKEQKNSLINEVVTKGLNPKVEMKNSGIEWIGEIPSHWDVMKLKYLSRITPSSVDKHIFDDEIQVSVCNYTHVYYNNFINTKVSLDVGSCTENEFSKFKLYKDDV